VEGKAKVALNAKKRQVGEVSVRALRRELGDVNWLFEGLVAARQMAEGAE
jgi:hypothetical protein